MPDNKKSERTYLHPYEALELIISSANKIDSETIALKDSYNRVLVNNMYAQYDDPPFNKSSMDGYAYNSLSDKKNLKLIKDKIIQAGDSEEIDVPLGQAIKIMTGAKVPKNCDRVQRLEWVSIEETSIIFTKDEMSSNIIKCGENVLATNLILNKKILKPKDIAILASAGYGSVEVYKKIKVAVFSTGRELVDIGSDIGFSKIYDSNGYMLYTSLIELACDVKFFGVIDDNEKAIRDSIEQAITKYDLIVLSGGVSMGDYDLIPKVLDDMGAKKIFHGLKMKPGKPCYFSSIANSKIFALPGNPLSSFVCFNVFVKSYIFSLLGIYSKLKISKAKIVNDYKRLDCERFEFVPAFVDITSGEVLVNTIVAKSSSMLQVLNNANSFILVEPDVSEYKKDSFVQVMIYGELNG